MPRPKSIIYYKDFVGINNVNNPRQLNPQELIEATNVDITDRGQIEARKSPVKISDNVITNLFASNIYGLIGVYNNSLYSINDNLEPETLILEDIGSNKVSYVEYANRVYLTNSRIIGYIDNFKFYYFDEPNIPNRVKIKAGSFIEIYHGRLFVANGNILYYSDAMDFKQMKMPDNFTPLIGSITNMKSVDTGIYVTTDAGIVYFLNGETPDKFELRTLAEVKALPNTMIKVSSHIFGNESPVRQALIYQNYTQGIVILFLAENGIFAGINYGKIFNLTENRYGKIDVKEGIAIPTKNKILTFL